MRWHCRIALASVFLFAAIEAAGAQPRRVLLLHSFGPHFAPWTDVAGRLREELLHQSPQPIDLFEASLETARFSQPDSDRPLLDYLNALFSDRKLDLVIALGAPAARFFQRYRSEILPAIPMLIAAADFRAFSETSLTSYDATVPLMIDQAVPIKNILTVLPDTTHIAVVIGDSPLERFWVQHLREVYKQFSDKVTFEFFDKLRFDEMVKRSGELPPHSAIYYGTIRVDVEGIPQHEDRVVARLYASAKAPIFSYIDTKFGQGIVGGPLISAQQIAAQSAAAAVRILNGEVPGTIRTPPIGLGEPRYDWRELRRWNISEARLPSGSTVHFRQPTIWELYRWQIIALAVAFVAQAAIIMWLLIEQRRRRWAEAESRNRLLELIHLNRSAEAGALSSSFAHELRQPLGAIALNAESAEFMLQADEVPRGRLKATVADIQQATKRASDIIQRISKLLRPGPEAELQVFDLKEAISDAVETLVPEARKRNIAIDTDGFEKSLPVRGDRVHLQQLITNLAINSIEAMSGEAGTPGRVTIKTAVNGKSLVEVSVGDTGPGIPKQKLTEIFDTFYTTKEGGTGLGLSIARKIVEAHGGTIWAENQKEGGALFRFTLPLSHIDGKSGKVHPT